MVHFPATAMSVSLREWNWKRAQVNVYLPIFLIFHQPTFPWNKGFPKTSATFLGANRSCFEVAISFWPDVYVMYPWSLFGFTQIMVAPNPYPLGVVKKHAPLWRVHEVHVPCINIHKKTGGLKPIVFKPLLGWYFAKKTQRGGTWNSAKNCVSGVVFWPLWQSWLRFQDWMRTMAANKTHEVFARRCSEYLAVTRLIKDGILEAKKLNKRSETNSKGGVVFNNHV